MLEGLYNLFVYQEGSPLIFSSGGFFLLFIVFLCFYVLFSKKKILESVYVVLFSLFFYYKSSGEYIWILIFTTLTSYFFGNLLYKAQNKNLKKLYVFLGILPSMGLLAYYKYANFFLSNFSQIVGNNFQFMDIFLPVGISFYTFQSASYIIDLYRGKVDKACNLLDYSFFLTFFPQLVAGPIIKASHFLPQIYKEKNISKESVYQGLWMIIIGLVKKAIIADYIAGYNDLIFQAPQNYTGLENLMAVLGYALQIFCDFSGYSDMAIGIGKILGYDLGINFDSPYKSKNISEFWRRWHISLSTWLKEYLYIPLGGNREISLFSLLMIPISFVAIVLVQKFCVFNLISSIIIAILGIIAYKSNQNIIKYIFLSLATIFSVVYILDNYFASIFLAIVVIVWIIYLYNNSIAKQIKTNVNLLLTMLIGGLWHGASWKFVFWGFMHGVGLGIDKIFSKILPNNKVSNIFSWTITFLFVIFLWLFFRANDIENYSSFEVPFLMLSQIFGNFHFDYFVPFVSVRTLWFVLLLFGYACHFVPKKFSESLQDIFVKSNIFIKIIVLLIICQLCIELQNESVQPFIYFNF